MKKCYFCKSIIQNIPYRCKFCGLLFCNKHRIPENHSCMFDLKIKFEKLLYEDALDFVEQKLTVAKIYEYVTKKELGREEALKLLNFFIESSTIIDNRINSLTALGLLNLNSEESFKVLENCLISDEDHEVRKTAAKVLLKIFPKRSEALINYALNQKLI